MRLLLVEDEEKNLQLFNVLLKQLGLSPDNARDMQTALDLIETKAYDLIITDKNMPGNDYPGEGGLDVLKYARKNNPGTQVILMTGYATLESAIEAMRLGAFDYIVKPFTFEELEDKIGRVKAYREFLNLENVMEIYRDINDEVIALIEDRNYSGLETDRHKRIRSFQSRLDVLFGALKQREELIVDQREALVNIAGFTEQLRELLPQDKKVQALLQSIRKQTEKMV